MLHGTTMIIKKCYLRLFFVNTRRKSNYMNMNRLNIDFLFLSCILFTLKWRGGEVTAISDYDEAELNQIMFLSFV